ncbi:MAG: bifunctional 4-hydroxy-2-oxoglutarate aldolase/2-dehydro-3-deoxy-phosphogluconate aldolase [Phormidesmis sp.]
MMSTENDRLRADWLALLERHRAIAVIRTGRVELALAMAQAAAAGGVALIEIAWNSSQPTEMIGVIQQALPHCVVGVGTVLSGADLKGAIAANAQFCFTPHTDCELIYQAQAHRLPISVGAMTPTEIIAAWRAGATSVKVFPISALGNGAYIRSLLGPLGPIPLVPTGGVTVDSAPELIAAGAIAVGLSTAIFPPADVDRGNWAAVTARSRHLLSQLTR